MKIKKTLAVVMATMMMATVLVGCTSGKNDGKGTGAASTEVVVDENGRSKVGIMYTEGLPIVDPGEYSFSLFVDDSKTDDYYVMLEILEEQTGIHVDLVKYPYEIAREKLNLALNSGEYADCIGGWTLTSTDILTLGMEEGVFIPLEEYYEKYCPRITEILDLKGVREIMTAPDGHIYSVPYVVEAPEVAFNPYINTRWLENVGMEVPTTTEELRAVLKAFKEQDANGNGNPNDEIPFSVDPNNKHLTELAGWFGMSVDKYGFTMVGNELTFAADSEEFKNGMRFLSELHKDGLVDPEMFTQDLSQWKAKGSQDLYGVCTMYASNDIIPYEPGVVPDFVPLPVLSSPECDTPVFRRDSYGTFTFKNQVVITDNAEHPEIIARWWDNFFELENSIQGLNGPLDVVLFKDGDGYRRIDTRTLSDEEQDKYSWAHMFPQALPKYVPEGFRIKEEAPGYEEKPVVDQVYGPYLTEMVPEYWASVEDATRLADLQTAIEEYLRQKIAAWVSGQTDIDSDWDAYLAQLEKLKVKELIELRKSALE